MTSDPLLFLLQPVVLKNDRRRPFCVTYGHCLGLRSFLTSLRSSDLQSRIFGIHILHGKSMQWPHPHSTVLIIVMMKEQWMWYVIEPFFSFLLHCEGYVCMHACIMYVCIYIYVVWTYEAVLNFNWSLSYFTNSFPIDTDTWPTAEKTANTTHSRLNLNSETRQAQHTCLRLE